MKNFLYFILLLCLIACRQSPQNPVGQEMKLKYSGLLRIEPCDSFTRVLIKNAWHEEKNLATYILVPRNHPLPNPLPAGTLIRTPLRKAILHSSVHAALLCDLQAESNIAGLADTSYIVSPRIRQLLTQNVADAGSSMQPDLEKMHRLQADAVLASPFENSGHGLLERAGIPIIECADYMEYSPLARAEWIQFYGLLFGKEKRADSIFTAIEKKYTHLQQYVARHTTQRPRVFCDLLTGSVWYQPGGHSTMGKWIADAGGDFVWKDRTAHGSIPLDMESVYAKAHQADIWLIKYGQAQPLTYQKMAKECPAYTHFSSWKNRQIYACNTLHTPFYEETPFHPERLLAELIRIFHPELNVQATASYYSPLQE